MSPTPHTVTGFTVRGYEVRQPGDGLCLTHSLLAGEHDLGLLPPRVKLPSVGLAWALRDELLLRIESKGDVDIWQDWTLEEWLQFELDDDSLSMVCSQCPPPALILFISSHVR